jgi:DNA-binding Xre family transcriptional regulator
MKETPPYNMLGFAARVINHRHSLSNGRFDLSLRKAAKQIGVSCSTLSRIECGGMPDLETFLKLCSWMDKTPNEVLGIKN